MAGPANVPGSERLTRGLLRLAGEARQDALVVAIKAIHGAVKARYGSPRIHAELVARDEPCCANTVSRLMRREGIAAKTKRKFRVTTNSNHGRPVAENVLNRQFEPVAPNRAWTADITYVATGEGWLYLAAVEDLYSRRIVGWSMGPRIDRRLVVDARNSSGRRRLIDPTTCERDYTSAEAEFMSAMQAYKQSSGRMFPTWSEVLEVLTGLGYVKADDASL